MPEQANEETLTVHLDQADAEAYRRWAADEDRTVSGQLRHVLRGLPPVKYYRPEEPSDA
jgi:hypothetical protein